ncbi:hypothetical protein AAG747_14865 [Rapidithrix thailandica]|uniref:Tetratricopeptide repeat protein n=1 Tax=Rapidithrix thailandica TaxID=413964 RepID=A0AAW9S5R1_9BACT
MNNYKSALTLIFTLGIFLSGCTLNKMIKMAQQQELKVEPSPLELHGDSVVFEMSAKLPVKMMKPKTTYDLEVYFQPTDGEELALGKVSFNGDDYQNATAEPSVSQTFSFAYQDAYERGQVNVKGMASKGTKVKEGEKVAIPGYGNGVITTSRLGQPAYYANYVAHGYDGREEYEPQHVEFFFLQGRSDLRWSEKRSDRSKQLEEYVSAKHPTRTVSITGMHSPEGPTDINSKLANERPKTVEEYYKKMADKFDYEGELEEINFVTKPVIEDWTEFKKLLNENSKLTDAQKNEILSIINGAGDFVSKELKLQTLPSYRVIFREIYPPLRTAKAEILKIKEKLTEPEIMVLAQKIANGEESADKLKDDELAYAASKTPSLEEREKMYEAAIKKNDSYASYNNLGATYLDMAKKASDNSKQALLEKAVGQFELSIKRQESPEAYANLAGAKMMLGDAEAAKEALGKVSGSSNSSVGASVNALKGYIAIRQGNYDEAIQALSAAGNDPVVLYNKALAYLLKASKEMDESGYSSAASSFDEAINADQDNAYAYYGAAITAVRMNNADKAFSYLKNAVTKSDELKERAAKDLEFVDFWSNAGFLDALK